MATGSQKSVTRERVLNAALELFSRDGFEATSVRDIARRANVGNGTVFWHFVDKAGLYAQTIEFACDRLLGMMRCDLEDYDATLAEVLVAWVGVLRRAEYLTSLLRMGRRSSNYTAIASAVASFERRLIEYWEGRLAGATQSVSAGTRRNELAQVMVASGRVFATAKAATPVLVQFAAILERTISEGCGSAQSGQAEQRSP